MNELSDLEKKASFAIELADDKKKDILAVNKDVMAAQKNLHELFKNIIERLAFLGKEVETFEGEYDKVKPQRCRIPTPSNIEGFTRL